MTDKLSKTAQTLVQRTGMPAQVAQQKAASVGRGVALSVVGLLLMVGGGWLVVRVMTTTGAEPSLSFLVFAGLPVLGGLLLVWAGGHIVSGDAMRAAAESGGVIGKMAEGLLSLVRGKREDA